MSARVCMCVYMCECVCVHCVCVNVYMCACVYVHVVYACVCMHVCVCMCAYACLCVHVCVPALGINWVATQTKMQFHVLTTYIVWFTIETTFFWF